jgi:hypothetical protein
MYLLCNDSMLQEIDNAERTFIISQFLLYRWLLPATTQGGRVEDLNKGYIHVNDSAPGRYNSILRTILIASSF